MSVLNHVYTTVALLDRLPYIHSCSLCSCSRSWRVNDIVVPSEHHLIMRLTTFWSMKLKTSMDFQMFQFLEDQLEKPKPELHSIYKTLTQVSQLRCCRAATGTRHEQEQYTETNYLNHWSPPPFCNSEGSGRESTPRFKLNILFSFAWDKK